MIIEFLFLKHADTYFLRINDCAGVLEFRVYGWLETKGIMTIYLTDNSIPSKCESIESVEFPDDCMCRKSPTKVVLLTGIETDDWFAEQSDRENLRTEGLLIEMIIAKALKEMKLRVPSK